jgi:fructose-1,6-bisphosphatase/inositol monophosphatase family enzyme
MTLTAENLISLAQYAISAARKAGIYIAETRPHEVQRKACGDNLASQVVTEVDRQSQDMILQILAPTLEIFDLALLTEESEDDLGRLDKDAFWCIDPIDGTLPFIEAVPGYAVSIALVSRDGTPLVGVVYDPFELTLYHAIRGQGAYRNGIAWQAAGTDDAAVALSLITDRSFAEQACYPKVLAMLERVSGEFGFRGLETTTHGGGVMNACWVLENPPACYFKFPRPQEGGGSCWDFAATACIFHEAGAIATDIFGAPLELNRPESTFMNHRGILYATDAGIAKQIMQWYATQADPALAPIAHA